MKIQDLVKYLYDCKVEIDTEDFETIWQGNSQNKKIQEYYLFDILDITTCNGYILIRVTY